MVTDLIIPNDVTEILDFVFYQCNSLQSVTFSKGVSTIGKEVFYGCKNLKAVYSTPLEPPTASFSGTGNVWGAFTFVGDNFKIYVPTVSVDIYKKCNGWKDYAAKIAPYSFE